VKRPVPIRLTPCLVLLVILFGGAPLSADVPVTIVHSFDRDDGMAPNAALVDGGDGYLYGTTQQGGGGVGVNDPAGTVFRMTTDGSVTTLFTFDFQVTGDEPYAGVLRLDDGTLFGTTRGSGAFDGNVFQLSSTGDFTNLHGFLGTLVGDDGGHPDATLAEGGDGNLYGTTTDGGDFNAGTLYRIDTGGGYTLVHSFSGGLEPAEDGTTPEGALLLGDDGALYGTTSQLGQTPPFGAAGTVFRYTPGVAGVVTLHTFHGTDGSGPNSTLVKGPGGYLYGTTSLGGDHSSGTAFRIREDGSGFESLHSFDYAEGSPPTGLVPASDGNFYGTSSSGGASGLGTVFRLRPSGTVDVLFSFSSLNGGGYSPRPLIQASDGNFYGTTYSGGAPSARCGGGCGTVFEIAGSDILVPVPEPEVAPASGAAGVVLALASARRRCRDRSKLRPPAL